MAKTKAKAVPVPGKEGIGNVYPSGSMFFREDAGVAKDESRGVEYELSTQVGTGAPLVKNLATGKTFALSWTELVDMARRAGVDE